jgi:DNA repair exonuclease SbcCD ATPase subunit
MEDYPILMPQASTAVPDTSERDLVEIMKMFGNSVAARAALEQERCSAKTLLDRRNQECLKMESEIAKFPAHKQRQDEAKKKAEEQLRTINEKYDRSIAAIENSAVLFAAQVAKVKAAPADNGISKRLQERCVMLEKKVQVLEQATKKDRDEREIQRDDLLKKLNAQYQDLNKNVHQYDSLIKESHQSLCKIVEEQDRVAKKEFQSARERLNNHEKKLQDPHPLLDNLSQNLETVQRDIRRISAQLLSETAAKLELQKKSEETSKAVLTLSEGSIQQPDLKKDIESVSRIVTGVQERLDAQITALTSSNEKLKEVDELKNCVVGIQNGYNDLIHKVDTSLTEAKTIKARIDTLEKAPTPGARSGDVLTATRTSNPTVIGVLQTQLRDLQRDMKLWKDRVVRLETPISNNDSTSPTRVEEKLALLEEKLALLEKSLEEVRSLAESTPRVSPFSTVAQNLAELKGNVELLRAQRTDEEKVLNQRLEEFHAQIGALSGKWLSSKGEIDGIRANLSSALGVGDAMKELTQQVTRLSTHTEERLNLLNNRQEGASLAVTHLANRFANVSTSDLARHMVSQIETMYPTVRNVENTLLEMRRQLSRQQTVTTTLHSQIASLELRVEQNATLSASTTGNKSESLRQELDSLTKDQLAIIAVSKNNKATLERLNNTVTESKATLDRLNDTVAELTGDKTKLADLSETVGELSKRVEELQNQQLRTDKHLKGLEAEVEACLQEVMPRVDAIEEVLEPAKNGKGLVLNPITNNRSSLSSIPATESERQSSVQSDLTNRKRKQTSISATNGTHMNGHSDSKSPTRKRSRRGENEQPVGRAGNAKKLLGVEDEE